MTPEEHDALILATDHIKEMKEKHRDCDIPGRVNMLERQQDRQWFMLKLILALVGLGRLVDSTKMIDWVLSQI